MSMSLKIEPRNGYLYVEVTGRYSIDEACRMFREGVREFARHTAGKVLVNSLRVTGSPRTMDHYKYGEFVAAELAEFARTTNRRPPQLAYVASVQILDRERLAPLVAGNRGITMASFETLREALAWLEVEPDSPRAPACKATNPELSISGRVSRPR